MFLKFTIYSPLFVLIGSHGGVWCVWPCSNRTHCSIGPILFLLDGSQLSYKGGRLCDWSFTYVLNSNLIVVGKRMCILWFRNLIHFVTSIIIWYYTQYHVILDYIMKRFNFTILQRPVSHHGNNRWYQINPLVLHVKRNKISTYPSGYLSKTCSYLSYYLAGNVLGCFVHATWLWQSSHLWP